MTDRVILPTATPFIEVIVRDPVSGGDVEVQMYRHQNGGIFGIDSSYLSACGSGIETVDEKNADSDAIILDPFNADAAAPMHLKVRLYNDESADVDFVTHRMNALVADIIQQHSDVAALGIFALAVTLATIRGESKVAVRIGDLADSLEANLEADLNRKDIDAFVGSP